MRTLALTCSLVVVLAAALVLQSGCSSLTQTQAEHLHVYDRDVYHDIYLLPDDVDTFFMLDRPTRLSRWLVTY
jgi:hypothetical protein